MPPGAAARSHAETVAGHWPLRGRWLCLSAAKRCLAELLVCPRFIIRRPCKRQHCAQCDVQFVMQLMRQRWMGHEAPRCRVGPIFCTGRFWSASATPGIPANSFTLVHTVLSAKSYPASQATRQDRPRCETRNMTPRDVEANCILRPTEGRRPPA